MKRILSLLLALALLPVCVASAEYEPIPEAFIVTYNAVSRTDLKGGAYVSTEHITTVQPSVDEAINAIVDAYDAEYTPTLTPRPTPKRNSRLDINVVHSVCGRSLVSFKVLARVVLNRIQQQSPFVCHTYDMSDGHEIFLTDIYAPNSPAWDEIAQIVRTQLNAYFPSIEAPADVLDALCTREALQQAPFTLSPFSFSLHYTAETLYPGQPTLMRVTIPFYTISAEMTEYGARNTDSSMYKYVALTYDDGPSYANTANLVHTLRHGGAHATFFLLGNLISEYPDMVMREHDEDHSVQSHHWSHVNAEESTAPRLLTGMQQGIDAIVSVAGHAPIMMRPPYGKWRPFVEAGVPLPQIIWDVDTKDWGEGRTPTGVMNTVRNQVSDGSIILMHDIQNITNEATIMMLPWLREQGYLCVTVEELFWRNGTDLEPSRNYSYVRPVAE